MHEAGRAGVGRRWALGITVVVFSALLMLPAGAPAVGRAVRAHQGGKQVAKPFFDSRVGARRAAARARVIGSKRERSARARLRNRLGSQAVVQVDALTGTARSIQRLDGALTGPAEGDRSAVALRWVRDNRAALGLTAADVDALTLADRVVSPGSGITHLRYAQSFRGIPTFDNDLRVNLDRGGRILNVTGSPVSGLGMASVAPKLDAVAALRALQRNVGVERAIDVRSGPSGDRRTTRFANGDFARLVLFDGADGVRLAWHLTYQATSLAYYDAVVDATTGAILFRQNLTKFDADQSVFPNYPGAEKEGGDKGLANAKVTVHFEGPPLGWLPDGETTLNGPFAHVFSDVNDNDQPGAGEEITRTNGNADFNDAFTDFPTPGDGTPSEEINACEFTDPIPDWPNPIGLTADCSWNPRVASSWETNRAQNGVQAFYFANVFHDHLESGPIGFNAASGNFEGADKVVVNTDDGADTKDPGNDGGPDAAHINNANMATPPDGQSPRMQMYLFKYNEDPDAFFKFRNINGGDDAATVWHEYTHGLSSRLITHADGSGAVSSPHAGAMGEAWSDWYALDFLHRQGLEIDDPAVDGEVDIGVYSDAVFASTRFEPIDCPVTGFDSARCPGDIDLTPGGFTFGDFGHVLGFPEVHSDGEIWAQTLWDLRTRLIADRGDEDLGSDAAEELITEGMRSSPPEPSFLDMRNAILAAEAGLGNGDRALVWDVFADRGMGFFAGAADSSDTSPTQDFNGPPAAGAPKGIVAGTVTSADTGLPLGGVAVGFGGLTTTTTPAFPDRIAPTTSAANGRYSLQAPAGRYGGLVFDRAGWDRVTVRSLQVTGGATRTQNVALRRDWAASRGGATVSGSDDTGADFGCGVAQLIDQSQGVGWSPFNPNSTDPGNPHSGAPRAVIRLPQTIDITAFGMNPGNTCGDDGTATTKGFKVETSADGVTYAVARTGSFSPSAAGRLNILTPTANARNVRFVRLTLLSPQRANVGDSGADFIDFSEFEVFGGPRNVLPSGTLRVSATRVNPGDVVTFGAQFGDPDSKITGYDWDFDGNGTVDRTTTTPATTFAYSRGGDFTARVAAKDFRGGAGTATAAIHVTKGPKVRIFKRGTKGKAKFRVTCELRCSIKAKLRLSKRLAKRLGLYGRTVGSLKRTLSQGSKRYTIKLTKKAKRAIKADDRTSIKATLAVTARYTSDGRKTAPHRTVKIKL